MTGTAVRAARAIVDTSVVIAEDVAAMAGLLAISAVTQELHFGVLVAKTAEVRTGRLRRLTVLQRHFEPLPVDEAVAVSSGRLAGGVVDVGRQPSVGSWSCLSPPQLTSIVPGCTPVIPRTSPASMS